MTVIQFQKRHDTAANWTAANPILAIGEMGYETDTKKDKTGDGVTHWASLPYNTFELPVASGTTLGGVKVGARLTITDGVLSADQVVAMTPSVRGGARLGSGLQMTDDVLSAVPYSLPIASSGSLGGIRVGANMQIDGSGILTANVTDPTGLTGTTADHFQIDNDNNGPILSYIEYLLNIDKSIRIKDILTLQQSSRDSRHCIDGLEAIAALWPTPGDAFDGSASTCTINSMSWAAGPFGPYTRKLVINVTATANQTLEVAYPYATNLNGLVRCVSWYRLNATPLGTTAYNVITRSSNYSEQNTFNTIISTGNSDIMMDDEVVLTESGSFTGENVVFKVVNLPAGTYNFEIQSVSIQGYNELELRHTYGNAGTLDIQWKNSSLPAYACFSNRLIMAGFYDRFISDNSNPFFARYMAVKAWDTNSSNMLDFNLVDMPMVVMPGSTYYNRDKFAKLDCNLMVTGSKGIILSENYADKVQTNKYPIANAGYPTDLTGWTAVGVENATVNSHTRVVDESPSGSNAQNINVTVPAGTTGMVHVLYTGAHRLMYPTRLDTSVKCSRVNGVQGITFRVTTRSEWNCERWWFYQITFTSTSTGWRSMEIRECSPPTYDSAEDYMDWAGEEVLIELGGLQEGTYDIRIGPVGLFGESCPMIQNSNSFDFPNAINVTSNEDTPVPFLVEGNIVVCFRGSSAVAPDGAVQGHCYIDTSGTPTFKFYDGTSWI